MTLLNQCVSPSSAGNGASGALGGNGGTISILMNEDDTHLLMAVQWNVNGGSGGIAGRHGSPGLGGQGGQCGSGHTWTETVGYRYYCTDNCIGREARDNASIRSSGSTHFGARSRALMAMMTTQTVQGPNLQALLSQAAASYGARRNLIADPGNCRCAGGDGNCVGCGHTAVDRRFSRVPGLAGRNGADGKPATINLSAGSSGLRGTVQLYVRDGQGNVHAYTDMYNLELVSFEVEDENGDGVFEPGERVILKRIRIRNTGGMPSPTRPISLRVQSNEWLIPDDIDALDLPPSIGPGSSVSIEGQVGARIGHVDRALAVGEEFCLQTTIALTATMPWLNRELPHFNVSQSIRIEYPFEIQGLTSLSTLAQGSTGRINWKVLNKSNLPAINEQGTHHRILQVDIEFPPQHGNLSPAPGSLPSAVGESSRAVSQEIENIQAKQVLAMEQLLKISWESPDHSNIPIDVFLYLDDPQLAYDGSEEVQLVLVQQQRHFIQISQSHSFDPEADVLLVTNSQITRHRAEVVRNFLEQELRCRVDQWNIGLYGGLRLPRQDDESEPGHILSMYRGKVIILMGNKVDFFGTGVENIAQICDPRALQAEAVFGTSFLFLDCADDIAFQNLVQRTVCALDDHGYNGDASEFKDARALIESLAQQELSGRISLQTVGVSVGGRSWGILPKTPQSAANDIAKQLRKQLPQVRCLVSSPSPKMGATGKTERRSSSRSGKIWADIFGSINLKDNCERVVVSVGLPHRLDVCATSKSGSNGRELTPFEKYSFVASFPASQRASKLWSSDGTTAWSAMALDAAGHSLTCDVAREIKQYLKGSATPSAQYLTTSSKPDLAKFLKLHIPSLATLLHHPLAKDPSCEISDRLRRLFQLTIACCHAQKKRHVLPVVLTPFISRRKELQQLLVQEIRAILDLRGYTEVMLKQWREDTAAMHSMTSSTRRDAQKLIRQQAAEMSQVSEHHFVSGRRTSAQIVPLTRSCAIQEWEKDSEAIKTATGRIKEVENRAQSVLDAMIAEDAGEKNADQPISELAATESVR